MKKIRIVLIFSLCLLFLTSCKSKSEIKNQVSSIVNFYDATPIMEKFKDTQMKNIGLVSWISKSDKDFYYSTTMNLQYDSVDKAFYGEFSTKKSTYGENRSIIERDVQYIKLDQEGYHPREGEELSEKAKNFKFMFEMVDFKHGYLNTVKLAKSVYNFELSDYYVEYVLTKKNEEIRKYLENMDAFNYGWGKTIDFTVSDQGKKNMRFFISKDNSFSVYEYISYSGEDVENSKQKYYGGINSEKGL